MILFLLAVVSASPVWALEPVVDLSPVRLDRVEFQWQPVVTRRAQTDEFHQMIGEVNAVEFQLDLAQYMRKNIRLYFVVPFDARALSSPEALQIAWPAQGRLIAGQAVADQRVLVFQGAVDQAIFRERLSLRLKVDSRRFNPPLNSQPRFEVELIR
jgi:hypothetical protein